MSVVDDTAKNLENVFSKHGFQDFKWINPKEIVVAQWVRLKCEFGCEDYGNSSCPPNLPSVSECKMLFKEYSDAWIFRFTKTGEQQEELEIWLAQIKKQLLELERDVFIQGYVKTFLLSIGICSVCSKCVEDRADCKQKKLARPSPEGMAVDVFSTVSKVGFPIKVLKDHMEETNRYAILLVR